MTAMVYCLVGSWRGRYSNNARQIHKQAVQIECLKRVDVASDDLSLNTQTHGLITSDTTGRRQCPTRIQIRSDKSEKLVYILSSLYF
jgi:hypothetical protein